MILNNGCWTFSLTCNHNHHVIAYHQFDHDGGKVDPPLDSFHVTKEEDDSLVQGDAHQAQHRGTLYNVNDDRFDNLDLNVDPVGKGHVGIAHQWQQSCLHHMWNDNLYSK